MRFQTSPTSDVESIVSNAVEADFACQTDHEVVSLKDVGLLMEHAKQQWEAQAFKQIQRTTASFVDRIQNITSNFDQTRSELMMQIATLSERIAIAERSSEKNVTSEPFNNSDNLSINYSSFFGPKDRPRHDNTNVSFAPWAR